MDAASTEVDYVKLPLDQTYQTYLLKEICDDKVFGASVLQYLKPNYFLEPIEIWSCARIISYNTEFGAPPSLAMLMRLTDEIQDVADRDNYRGYLYDITQWLSLAEDERKYLRSRVMHFARRRHFREAMDHATRLAEDYGREEDAHDYMIKQMAKLNHLRFVEIDRTDLLLDFEVRRQLRRDMDRSGTMVSTGFPTLDHLLGGGLEKKRLGIWLAYSGGGKSALLVNLGVAAARQMCRVLHMIYEGSREEVEDRYDAAFGEVAHRLINRVEYSEDIANKMRAEYARLGDKIILRAYTKAGENMWNSSVQTIADELAELKQTRGWVPDLIIVDYGDLLAGRDKSYGNTTERQQAVFQDLKSLANQGYALWTASQPQRPGEDAEIRPHIIQPRMIANCHAKVNSSDFIGSINSTNVEREARVARLHVGKARNSESDATFLIRADFEKMIMREEDGLKSPHGDIDDTLSRPRGFGYRDEVDPKRKNGVTQSRAF